MIDLRLDGPVVPKARPCVTRNGSYMPPAYRRWKTAAISQLKCQYQGAALENVAVSIVLRGKHPRRGDADNVAGALLDALVQAGILRNDNLMCVPSLAVRLEYSQDEPLVLVSIRH